MHSSVGMAGRALIMLACVVGLLVWAVSDASWSDMLKKLQNYRWPAILEPVAASTSAPLEEAPRFGTSPARASSPAAMSAPLCQIPAPAATSRNPLSETPPSAVISAEYQASAELTPPAPLANIAGDAAAGPTSSTDPFRSIQDRLRELGATYYLLESWGTGQQMYRFYCKMSVGGSADYTRYFEASHADPLQAMREVLGQVESWRAGTTSQ